ncbi:conserved Plasmodium protein, unknown function [Plasmodium malariae]|uniref:Uncharacterized protein n=1 Tax=Plasmodium malariae TaxID=5858 RepID=A0A1C3KYF0_PLAMA|nr:conserved Plasmodium protein, unknown function [Plasmodium malariae]
MMKEDDELNLVRDYLNELSMCSEKLYNTNYYNSLSRYKKLGDKKDYAIMKCLRMDEDQRSQFISIDNEEFSTSKECESSLNDYSTEEKTEGQPKGGKREKGIEKGKKKGEKKRGGNYRKEDKKEDKKEENEIAKGIANEIAKAKVREKTTVQANGKKEKEYITFSFNKQRKNQKGFKDSGTDYKSCKLMLSQKDEVQPFDKSIHRTKKALHEGEIIKAFPNSKRNDCVHNTYDDCKKKETSLIVCREGNTEDDFSVAELGTTEEGEKGKDMEVKRARKQIIGNYINNDNDGVNVKRSYESSSFCTQEGSLTSRLNKMSTTSKPYRLLKTEKGNKSYNEDKHEREKNIVAFSNQHEQELFEYLILKANDEIEKISSKLENKYKNELLSRVNNIKYAYEKEIKKLLKNKAFLCVENEKMNQQEKDNQEIIKELEHAKLALLNEMEKIKKNNNNEWMLHHDMCFQKEMLKNDNEKKIRKLSEQVDIGNKQILQQEKKICMLNDNLNSSSEKCFYLQSKWDAGERALRQKDEEIENLKIKLHKWVLEKNEVEDKLMQLQDQNGKIERDNDCLRSELNNAKLHVVKLKEQNEEVLQNSDYVQSCYKREEKKLKEDLENYKTVKVHNVKCALLENKNDLTLLEEKYKKLQIELKDLENEKCIYERTCLKNE